MMEMADWKPVPGYVGYFATPRGEIWSVKKGRPRLLTQTPNQYGYARVSLAPEPNKLVTLSAHSVIAAAFIGPRPPGLHIAHLNSDRADNRPDNLAYVTAKENVGHALQQDRFPRGERAQSKLTENDVRYIRAHYVYGDREFGMAALARRFGVSSKAVCDLLTGRTWRHVDMVGKRLLTAHERDIIVRWLDEGDEEIREGLRDAIAGTLETAEEARRALSYLRSLAEGKDV